jgi:WD40 repeat protein
MIPVRPAEWSVSLTEPVIDAAWSADGAQVAAIGSEGTAWLVGAADGAIRKSWLAHEGGGFRIDVSRRDGTIASSGQDGHVRLSGPDGTSIGNFQAGSAWVEQLAWSPDGTWLVVAAGRTVTLWQPGRGVVHVWKDHKSTITALAWRADGQVFAAACYGTVALYRPDPAALIETLPWKTSLISVAPSPDGRWVVAGTQEQSVQIWELPFQAGDELAMSGYAGKVRELAWHMSGRYLATGGGDEIMVWDCGGKGPAGSTPRILEGHQARVNALDYQRTGHLLASGGEDGAVLFWNAGKSSQPLRQTRLNSAVRVVRWSPDQKRVLAGLHGGELAVCPAPT